MVMLFDEEEVRTLIRQRLDSREWWFFLMPHNTAIGEIEERFYSGKKSSDFHLVIMPTIPNEYGITATMVPLFIALKKHMTPRQLAAFLNARTDSRHALDEEITTERDILMLPTMDNIETLKVVSLLFNAWVRSRPGETPLSGEAVHRGSA